jgi:hypothetical protein
VRRRHEVIQVRDSNDPAGPVLAFTPAAWRAFLDGMSRGEFDTVRGGLTAGQGDDDPVVDSRS